MLFKLEHHQTPGLNMGLWTWATELIGSVVVAYWGIIAQ